MVNVNQAYFEPCHGQNSLFRHYSAIFRILEYSEAFHNCIPTHNQNPDIFTKIGESCVTLKIQDPGKLAILKYSEP